jgi:queuine/archaeosine tRNA-ribosyltransferase
MPASSRISVPAIWLGQSVDTSSICSGHAELSSAPFLTSLGCAIRRPSLKYTHLNAQLKEKLGISGPLMVDSGGFHLMMNPKSEWNVGDVSKFMRSINAEIFVSLDYPPSKRDSVDDRKRKIELSATNFKILTERFPNKIVMPVVHGRTISEVDLSVQLIARHIKRVSWIGLGGIVPLLQHRAVSREISHVTPEAFIALSLEMIRAAFPNAKIHAFGAGGTRTFPAVFAFGADSADSIGWRQAAGFGSIFLPLTSQRVVKWNAEKRPPRKLLEQGDFQYLQLCKCPICVRRPSIADKLSAFRVSFYNRSIHNAWAIINQVKYWPRGREGVMNLISKGDLGAAWARAANLINQ